MRKRLSQLKNKVKGKRREAQPPISLRYALWGLLSGTISILIILWVATLAGHPLLIGSFGASAVLLFGAHDSPLAQPRNLIGGHLISACVAVALVAIGGSGMFVTSLSVGLAIFFMHITRTVHPPGGATALIGVLGHAGPSFLLVPVLTGSLILLLVALFTNNIVYHRQYPKHWL